MNLSVRPYGNGYAEVTVEGNGMKYTEDVISGGEADEGLVYDLITVARQLSNITNVTDVMFVKSIVDAFLNDSERKELIEAMKEEP